MMNNKIFQENATVIYTREIADNTFSKIDNEIINISKISLNNAMKIIRDNRILLEKLVEILIVNETIENKIFKEITYDLIKV